VALPTDPNTLLRRRPCATALTEAGFQTSAATLATKATRGGGPPFRRFGRVPLYRWGDALEWANSLMSAPMRSTSEADASLTFEAQRQGMEGTLLAPPRGVERPTKVRRCRQ
jgi:hypothetical protein